MTTSNELLEREYENDNKAEICDWLTESIEQELIGDKLRTIISMALKGRHADCSVAISEIARERINHFAETPHLESRINDQLKESEYDRQLDEGEI